MTVWFICIGNVEVTRLMLESGANASHINSVNRSATQMAAFVGKLVLYHMSDAI